MADTQASPQGKPGTGRYAIHAEIGAGGMATVHLGRLVGARGFARTVAIKVLHASYAKNAEFVERFLDEARIVGRIHHPNVMPTLDVIAEGTDLRIVMDYVAGESLDRLEALASARGERVPVRIACAIVAAALHGLHAAHEAKNEFGEPLGIVHLDVSPQNILVGADGTCRLLDFGVARARATTERSESPVSGKSAYLAPEQIRRTEVTPRTDVFAASIVLWELLTGEPLFAADNHAATMQRVMSGDVPAVSTKVPGVSADLDAILRTGLARDPGQRFPTARDMALAIERAVAPALPSEIGGWVTTIAEATLVARAKQVQAMESEAARGSQMPELVEPRALFAEQVAANSPPPRAEDSLLTPPPGGPNAVPQRAPDGSIRWKPRTTDPAPPLETALRAAAKPAPAPSPPKRKGRPVAVLVATGVVVLVLAIVVAVARTVLLPGYVTSTAIASAAAHGVTLTVEDAALSEGGVELRGLTVALQGVPQIACRIVGAEVRSIWGPVAKVVLGKTEVSVDGEQHAVQGAVAAWSKAHRGKSRPTDEVVPGGQIDVPSAHLLWTHPTADIARIEATGVQGAVGSPTSLALGDELHFLVKTLTLDTRVGLFGPWTLDVDATLKETRARLAFDPAIPDGPNAFLVVDSLGTPSLDVSVPRVGASTLGVPRGAVGPDIPFPQQLEVALHYAPVGHDQATATLKAAFYGLRLPELGGLVDAHLSGEAAGPRGGALTVKNGLFTLGALRAAVTGTVTPVATGPSVKANLAWKAEPVACATLVALPTPGGAAVDLTKRAAEGDLGDLGELARDFGALGQAVGAVKVTGSFAAWGTLVADSSDLAHARFASTAKNACGLALLQGRDPRDPPPGR